LTPPIPQARVLATNFYECRVWRMHCIPARIACEFLVAITQLNRLAR
jgi:hypothetical protein